MNQGVENFSISEEKGIVFFIIMIYNKNMEKLKERKGMEKIRAKDAVAKLREIRFKYETGQLDMATANRIGQQYVQIFNDFSKETAKKYGIKKGVTIPNNVKFYPNR